MNNNSYVIQFSIAPQIRYLSISLKLILKSHLEIPWNGFENFLNKMNSIYLYH